MSSSPLYQKFRSHRPPRRRPRFLRMGQSADAHDLRSLLSVAARLRQLAGATLCRGDQALYLMTAEALEKRAGWLAGLLQEADTEPNPVRHQPVDLVV